MPPPPDFAAGVLLAGAPGAGALFPQPWGEAGGRVVKLDDVLGPGAWLITRAGDAGVAAPAPVRIVTARLDEDRLAPFRADLTLWLDQRGAEAVLVRPDRYVFAAGEPRALLRAFAERIGLAAAPA